MTRVSISQRNKSQRLCYNPLKKPVKKKKVKVRQRWLVAWQLRLESLHSVGEGESEVSHRLSSGFLTGLILFLCRRSSVSRPTVTERKVRVWRKQGSARLNANTSCSRSIFECDRRRRRPSRRRRPASPPEAAASPTAHFRQHPTSAAVTQTRPSW